MISTLTIFSFLPLGLFIGFVLGFISGTSKKSPKATKENYPIDVDQLCQRIENGYFEFINDSPNSIFKLKNKEKMVVGQLIKGYKYTNGPEGELSILATNAGVSYFNFKDNDITKILNSINKCKKEKYNQIFEEMDIDKGNEIVTKL